LVNTGDDIMIGCFILGSENNGATSFIVRALGPSLSGSDVPNPLRNPTLGLRDGDGSPLSRSDTDPRKRVPPFDHLRRS